MGRLAEFAQNNFFLVFALLASLAALMFHEIRLKTQGLTHISSADALRIINKGAMIVDVRSAEAFDAGHIVKSRNIVAEHLQSGRPPLKRKNRVVLTVCEDGAVSGKAARSLRSAGHDNVFSLKGGLKQWRAENLPLVT